MRFHVTIEVENVKLFDAVRQFGTESIGARLVETFLAPDHTSVSTAIGMAVYGVTVAKVEKIEENA